MTFSRYSLLGAAMLLASAGAARACEDSPKASVERFHAALLGVMKEAKALGTKGRYDRLAPEVTSCFDMRLMSRVATDSAWRDAGDADRETLVAAFSRMSIATYASQFSGHDGESFETLAVVPGPQDTQLVKTRIVLSAKSPVPLTYVMKKTTNSPTLWRVADILLDGDISQLATRRSEYRATLKDKGLAGLVATLNAKAEELLVK
ncbi:MAG: ABC transporter substrate-binding protein [Magnetospirillum sp. WYHS-4]